MELLPEDAECSLVLQPASLVPSVEAFEELWACMDSVQPTPNPRFKNSAPLHRRQCTFGAEYSFGAQRSEQWAGDWPALVTAAVEHAKALSSRLDRLCVVHANWYFGGKAWLAPHSDDESMFQAGVPIYSYTFVGPESAELRGFQVYRDGQQVLDLKLGHGDLLIMSGRMQELYTHGVKKMDVKAFRSHRRINLTVRHLRFD